MEFSKNDRMLEILIRCLRGERISPKKLADEYEVSTKSISRDISCLQNSLHDYQQLVCSKIKWALIAVNANEIFEKQHCLQSTNRCDIIGV